jgi:hypothetical protein
MLPNKKEFVNKVIDEITEGFQIPLKISEKRLDNIISNTMKKFKERDDDVTQVEYIILKNDLFHTELFKQKRIVQMPDCVHAITDLRNIGAREGFYNSNDPDFRKTNFAVHYDNFNWPNHSKGMLTAVGEGYYRNFISQFVLNSVAYRYSDYQRSLVITGKDPIQNLAAEAHVYITENAFYNMDRFFEYVCAKCRISYANVIGFADIPRIGGINLNLEDIREQGKEKIAEIEQHWKDQMSDVHFMIYED